jgi:hypothetical protein
MRHPGKEVVMYQTAFIPGRVDVHELETLVTWLSKKTGKAIPWSR